MARSKNTNPNIFRSKWVLGHGLETDYRRRDKRKEIEEYEVESSGSLKEEEEEIDLKPFWEESSEETEGEFDEKN